MEKIFEKRKRKGFNQRFNDHVSGYLYVLPFILLFFVFNLYPAVYTFYISLFKWSVLGAKTFVGFRNYRLLLGHDPLFWKSIGNTFIIWFETVPLQLILAILLAVLLNQAFLKGKSFFRFFIFLPNITSLVAIGLLFGNIFGVKYGLVNYVLHLLNYSSIDWGGSAWATRLAVSFLIIWRYTGYHMIIQLAGLQSIPGELYESATIDGANKVQQFFRITLPMLLPTIMFSVVISSIGGLQLFTEPYIFTLSTGGDVVAANGGPNNQVLTTVIYIYKTAFSDQTFGYSSAVATMLFVLVILFTVINSAIVRKFRS